MENSFLNKTKKIKVVSIVATKSNTGKTTLIEALVPALKEKNYSVGVLKHDAHKFEIDKKGKDSYRFVKAGADRMVISSKDKIAMVENVKGEMDIDNILELFLGMDLVIVEGYKNNKYPKIEVHRKEIDSKLLCEDDNFDKTMFWAVATNEKLNLNIQQFNINDINKIADFIEDKILKENK